MATVGQQTPKRSDQVRRRNTPPGVPISNAKAWPGPEELYVPEDYEIQEPDENWHPIAKRLYEDSLRSGQCYYWEASEYAMLYLMCESISRDMKPQVVGLDPETGEIKRARIPLKGTSLNAYLKMMGDLMLTEASRRRAHVELIRGFENEEIDKRSRMLQSLESRLAG